ncbi:MAG: hypothetical protein LKE40_02860 [Spirochaetia bacterium]|jgi:predicted Rossmann fold nucleotide-binding protein DprA/Smf involved in DNA uptake|nr:hypothetical protein [Spirochaetia bacterium]
MDRERKLLLSLLPFEQEQLKPVFEKQDLCVAEIESLIVSHRSFPDISARLDSFRNYRVAFCGEDGYPEGLYRLAHPPYRLTSDAPFPSTCGMAVALTCSDTAYDDVLCCAYGFSRALSFNGISVVLTGEGTCGSRMLAGIAAGGTVPVRVAGCGLDHCRHRSGVATVSCMEPWMGNSQPGARRNGATLLVGLASCLVVLQASQRSGSLSCVQEALDSGIECYVHQCGVDGRMFCRGSKQLFDDGAIMVHGYEDLARLQGLPMKETCPSGL